MIAPDKKVHVLAPVLVLLLASSGMCLAQPVSPSPKLAEQALAEAIDQEIQNRLDAAKIRASGPSDDAEYVRRVYLDIHGIIPPPEKVVAFLDSKDPDRRAKVIDELLASPQYGRNLAEIWGTLLLGDNQTIGHKGPRFESLRDWMVAPLNSQPWNKTVHDLLTSTGPLNENNAVRFYLNGAPGTRTRKTPPGSSSSCP